MRDEGYLQGHRRPYQRDGCECGQLEGLGGACVRAFVPLSSHLVTSSPLSTTLHDRSAAVSTGRMPQGRWHSEISGLRLDGHRDGEALALGELMPRSAWAMMTMIDVTDLTGTFTEAPIVTAGALVDDLDGCIPAVRARVQRWAARKGSDCVREGVVPDPRD